MNKGTIYFIVGIVFLEILLFLNNLIMYNNEEYAYFFVDNVLNFKNAFLYKFFITIETPSIFCSMVCFIILIIFVCYYERYCKKDVKIINKKINVVYRFFLILILLNSFSFWDDSNTQHLPSFEKKYFSEYVDAVYTKDDLIKLNEFLRDKILLYSDQFERDKNNAIIFNGNLNRQASIDLNNISKEISLLDGYYPTKSINLDDNLKGLVGSRTTGLTSYYLTLFDYRYSVVATINTITHEFCHTKGISRESDTEYCSFLAGVKSDNMLSNYAAYFEMFLRVNLALYEIDEELATQIEESLVNSCLTKKYAETCSLYTKNDDSYINGSKKLRIKTYSLKNYANKKTELYSALKLLKDNGAKMYVDDIEIGLDDVIKKIDIDGNKQVVISIEEFNNLVFNKIKLAFNDEYLFLAIYQDNEDNEANGDKKDVVNFYLGSYPDKDALFADPKILSEEFSYERVTRLLLDYYNKYGYDA